MKSGNEWSKLQVLKNKSCQNDKWSQLLVVKMKTSDKCSKLKVVKINSGQNEKWLK